MAEKISHEFDAGQKAHIIRFKSAHEVVSVMQIHIAHENCQLCGREYLRLPDGSIDVKGEVEAMLQQLEAEENAIDGHLKEHGIEKSHVQSQQRKANHRSGL